MPAWESIILYKTDVNSAEATLSALAPTSAVIRSESYGKAKITHAMALTSTDDVNEVRVVPSGYDDTNGFEIANIVKYSATLGFYLEDAKLPVPIEVYNNSTITAYARSRTAANTVVYLWLAVEYDGVGNFEAAKTSGAEVMRDLDAGSSLTSNTATDGTAITSLIAGKRYQVVAVSGVGVSGQTAGIVGPCFLKLKGPAEFLGLETWIPIPNSPPYTTGGSSCRLDRAGLKMPVFAAPNTVTPAFLDYTSERPVGKLHLLVDSAGIK